MGGEELPRCMAVYQHMLLFIIIIALFLGNFSNFTTANPDEIPVLNENIFNEMITNYSWDCYTNVISSRMDVIENENLLDSYSKLQNKPTTLTIFPPDDRVRITDTTIYPWCTICKLYIYHPSGLYYATGTGFMVDEFHVLTAGHCAYLHEEDGWPYDSWASSIKVIPGMNNGYEPYGHTWCVKARSYAGWVLYHMHQHDWALLTLDDHLGAYTGWMGRETAPYWSSIYTGILNTAGYPGDLDSGLNMYYCSGNGIDADEYNHYFDMDAFGGQSGSPVWRLDGSNRYVLSILTTETPSSNFGTRLNQKKFNDLNAWLNEDSPSTPCLSYSPISYDFGNVPEGEIDKTTFEIWNSGTGTLSYTLSENCSWCSISPASGSSTGEHDNITVNIDTTGLSVGHYSCNIAIESNGGSGTFGISIDIVEPPNNPPVANFTYEPIISTTQDIIYFNSTSYDTDGYIVNWTWNFGDGSYAYSEIITHQYGDDGSYAVNLTVRDNDGATNWVEKTVNVDNQPPIADFTFKPTNSTTQDVIHFNSTSTDTDGSIINWTWDFGDGDVDYGEFVTHQYSDNGMYNVSLMVTDDDGASDSTYRLISVSNQPPVAGFNYEPLHPTITDTIYFNSTSYDPDGSVINWTWDFGDGDTSYGQNTTHQYVDSGAYNVNLTVTDNYGSTNISLQHIVVYNSLTVYYIDVGQGDAILIQTPENNFVLIDAGKQSAASTVVNFLNNLSVNTLKAFVASHPDADHIGGADEVIENFDVLSIYHPGYEKDTLAYQEFIAAAQNESCPIYTDDDIDPGDFINISNIASCQILHIDKNASDSNDASIVLRVEFGLVSFLFTGDISSDVESDLIRNQNVDVDILKVAHHGSKYSTSDEFLNESTPLLSVISVGSSNPYGHPAPETLARLIAHNSSIYRTDLNGTITVTTFGTTWNVAVEKTMIPNEKPLANFTYYPSNPTILDTLQFTDTSEDEDGTIENWTWDFGDGATSTQRNPTHQYNLCGSYTVNLTIKDDDGASDSIEKIISLSNLPPVADAGGPYFGYINNLIIFDGANSSDSDGVITNYSWDFGEGTSGYGVSPSHAYVMTGNYTVTLTVKDDHGEEDTDTTTVTILPFPSVKDCMYCAYSQISPTIDGNYETNEWDDAGHYEENDLKIFIKHDDTYAYFCAISLHDINPVEQSGQRCSFTFDRNHDGSGQPIGDDRKYEAKYWYNKYTPQLNGWSYWYYKGTGTNCPYWQSNQINGYTDPSLPDDALFNAAYDSGFGCWVYEMRMPLSELNAYDKFNENTDTIGFAILIDEPGYIVDWPDGVNEIDVGSWGDLMFLREGFNLLPIANFTYSPSNPTTSKEIQFNDTSSDPDGTIINWTWDFGDGNISYEQNPSHVYADDGTYTVTLTVVDDDGATDTVSKQITVSNTTQNTAPTADFIYSPTSPLTLETVQFTDLSYDIDGTIVNYTWNFGDGNISYEQNPTHRYLYSGIYLVNLTVRDNKDAIDWCRKEIKIAPARFTGYFSDYGLDADDDGLYNYLMVKVGVNIFKGGEYLVRGSLQYYDSADGEWQFLDNVFSENFSYLSRGIHNVSLQFFMWPSVYKLEYNGTFNVSLELGRRTDDGIVLDCDSFGHTTLNIYNYSSFQIPDGYSLDYFNITIGHGIKYHVMDDWNNLDRYVWAVSQYFESNKPDDIDFVFTLAEEGPQGEYFCDSSMAGEIRRSTWGREVTMFYAGCPVGNQANFYFDFCLPTLFFKSGDRWSSFHRAYYVRWIGNTTVNENFFEDCIRVDMIITNESEYLSGNGYFILAKDVGIVKLVFNRTSGENVLFEYVDEKQFAGHNISGTIKKNDTSVPNIIVQISNADWGTRSVTDEFGNFYLHKIYGIDIVLRIGYDNDSDGFLDFDNCTGYPKELHLHGIDRDISGLIIDIHTNNVYPIADFSCTPTMPTDLTVIRFINNSTDLDGTIVNYTWNFGDRNISYEQNPTHQYADDGTYTVTLTVEDDDGLTDSISKQITVSNVAPTAVDDHTTIDEDTPVIINVSSNDYDNDGNLNLSSIVVVNPPLHGSAIVNTNGTITYTPDSNYYGLDSFNYTINDNDGTTSNIATVYITINSVNDAPVANFSYSPPTPTTQTAVQFTDLSYDIDGTIENWTWDFGDGATSTQQNPTHQYTNNGSYTVTLTVWDNDNLTDNILKEISIGSILTGPTSDFSWTPTAPKEGEIVTFTDKSIIGDGVLQTWYWEFGDGKTSTEQNPSHRYTVAGTYTVTLTVTDSNGLSNSTEKNLTMLTTITTILSPTDDADADWTEPNTNFGTDTLLCPTSRTSGGPTVSYVKFDLSEIPEGSTINDADFKIYVSGRLRLHYLSLGTVGNSWDEDTLTWNNKPGLTTNVGWIYVSSTSQWYSWDVTSEVSGALSNDQISFDMVLEDGAGVLCLYSKDMGFNVPTLNIGYFGETPPNNPPIADVNCPYFGYVNEQIIFDASDSIDSDGSVTGYRWDFNGDGIYDTGWLTSSTTTHIYTFAGTYNVNLQIRDNFGAKDIDTTIITIYEGDTEPPSQVTGLTVTDAKDGKLDLTWDSATDNVAVDHYNIYRDGTFLTSVQTTSYQDTGLTNGQTYTYEVSAVDTAGNEGNKSDPTTGTPTKTTTGGGGGDRTFIPPPPMNTPPDTPTTPQGVIAGFIDTNYTYTTSTSDPNGDDVYYWFDWGDNSNHGWLGPYGSGENVQVSHTWSISGMYEVRVKAKDTGNMESGWSNTLQVTITAGANYPPNTPTKPKGPTTGDTNTTYNFTTTATDPDNNTIKYEIDWGDNTNSTTDFVSSGETIIVSHSWTKEGTYNIRVKVIDEYLAESNWSQPHVFIVDSTKPIVSFITPKANVTLTANANAHVSVSDANTAGVLFELLLGNTVVDSFDDTEYPYIWPMDVTHYENGNYKLRATAYDIAGNNGTASVSVIISKCSTGTPGFETVSALVAMLTVGLILLKRRNK